MIYPHIFNIPKSCVSPEALSGRSRTVSGAIPYELTAVICHLGNDTTRGHYTAVCKDVSTGQVSSMNMIMLEYYFMMHMAGYYSGGATMTQKL